MTDQSKDTRYPQTTTTYRCSNQECQEEKDRQTAKRIKLRDDRKLADDKRAEDKLRRKSLRE